MTVQTSDMSWYTWDWYGQLLKLIDQNGFSFADYFDHDQFARPCILRHDVDYSLQRAVEMARFEAKMDLGQQVRSTYFVLINSEVYNPRSPDSRRALRELTELGHQIGLHFDTAIYEAKDPESFIGHVQEEVEALSELAGVRIKAMSMHRPSQEILAADLLIPGIVNTYNDFFFHQFKYVSDSGLLWREDPQVAVSSDSVERLHVLTHPIWYSKIEEPYKEKLLAIGDAAGREALTRLQAEICPRLSGALSEEEISCHFR